MKMKTNTMVCAFALAAAGIYFLSDSDFKTPELSLSELNQASQGATVSDRSKKSGSTEPIRLTYKVNSVIVASSAKK